jgi:hypothetical protein
MLQEQYHGELDVSPGSILRDLISSTAVVINQLQSQSVEQAREQIRQRLPAGVEGVPEYALTAMAEEAVQAQEQSRDAIIRDYLNSGLNHNSVADLVSHVGKQWVTTPADPKAKVEQSVGKVRTRWERLLDDSFLDEPGIRRRA